MMVFSCCTRWYSLSRVTCLFVICYYFFWGGGRGRSRRGASVFFFCCPRFFFWVHVWKNIIVFFLYLVVLTPPARLVVCLNKKINPCCFLSLPSPCSIFRSSLLSTSNRPPKKEASFLAQARATFISPCSSQKAKKKKSKFTTFVFF